MPGSWSDCVLARSGVGKALLGHKRGEEVRVTTPRGVRVLKITKIDVAA